MQMQTFNNFEVPLYPVSKFIYCCFFFKFYFCSAVPQPNLGHCKWDSLTNSVLITAFVQNLDPKVSRSLRMKLGPRAEPST